jgi:outer membrane autotransporter protein
MGLDNGPLFGNAQINVGAGDIEAQRQINVGGLSRTATSRDWTETLASGTLSGGYLIEFGELQLAPQGGLEYISLGRSSYEEGGGGAGVNLNVRDSRENLFRGFLGTSLGGTIDSGGLVIAPQAHVGVHHNFLNDVEAIVSEFVSAPGTSYTTVGQVPGSTSFVGGIAVDVSMGYWTIGAHYDAIISSGETVHSAGGNLYIKF